MSHFAKNKVDGIDVDKVDFECVKSAVKLLEQVFELEYVTEIKDWGGATSIVKGVGVKLKGTDYGFDMFMDNKTLVIEGEDMEESFQHNSPFLKEFKKAYTAVAMKKALVSQGLSTNLKASITGSGDTKKVTYSILAGGL